MSIINLFAHGKKDSVPKSIDELASEVFANPPVLQTERLMICKISESFASDMYEYSSDPDVTKYLTWSCHSSLKETERYLKLLQRKYADGTFHDWGVVLKSNGKFIGTCGYTSFDRDENTFEVGYVLAKQHWGDGLMTEAVKEVMHYAFKNFSASGAFAKFMEGNDASGRVMQKCGMTFEGLYKKSMYIKGEFKNIIVYRISREDFYKKNPEYADK